MRRWLRNVPTADRNQQAQHIFWYLQFCNQFLLVDFDAAASWLATAQATDGILSGALPSTFKTPNTQAYLFGPADVGRFLAIRDVTTPANSGIYRIASVPAGGHTAVLNAPVANFSGSSTNVSWTLYDVANKPLDTSWFVVQSPQAPAWQARCTVSAAAPAGLQFDMGAFGGWNATTHAWGLPSSAHVVLNTTTALTFAVADEQLGAFFIWSEDGGGNRTGVFCGTFAGFHSPQGQGVPRDDVPVALIGDNTVTANTLNRKFTGGTAGFAIHGQLSLPDRSGYAAASLHAWRRITDDSDVLSDAAALTDPRSGQTDSFSTAVYQIAPAVEVRGYLPLVRILNDSVANRVTVNGGSVYVIQGGIAAEWDGSSPV